MGLYEVTEYESTIAQALAMTGLLSEMSNRNFLKSDFYQRITFASNNEGFKHILEKSGLGNPATLQMFLYALLVMPKELLSNEDPIALTRIETDFNITAEKLNNIKLESTYTEKTFNYYRHIRNAVSHSHCVYTVEDEITKITFHDKNPKNSKEYCSITMTTEQVGCLLGYLRTLMIKWIADRLKKRKTKG